MITFELVSPEKKLFSAPVAMVTLPGSEGDFGVLPGHAPFIATMRVGLINVYEKGADVTQRILVSGGVVEVNPEQCTVLAEEAVNLKDITRDGLEADVRKYQDRLQITEKPEDKAVVEMKLARAQKKLEVFAVATAH